MYLTVVEELTTYLLLPTVQVDPTFTFFLAVGVVFLAAVVDFFAAVVFCLTAVVDFLGAVVVPAGEDESNGTNLKWYCEA